MSNQAKRIHSLLLTVLIGLSAWGCSGNDSPTGTHQDNVGSQAGAENGTGGNEPSVGGSDPGTGGRAVETGGSSTGGSDIPATGGSCGHACMGGSSSGGASPETGGEAGSSGSPDVGGEAGAIEGTGGSDDGGEGGSDPVGTGGEGGASGEPGTGGEAGQETGGASGSSNVGGEAGAIEGTGGSDDGGASGNPATGGEAGSDPSTGGEGGAPEGTGGASGNPGIGGAGGAVCIEEDGMCTESAECCEGLFCSFGTCQMQTPMCLFDGESCVVGVDICCSGQTHCQNGVCVGATCAANGSVCAGPEECCSDVCYESHCVNAPPEPLNCGTPVADAEFAAFEYDLVDGLWASALNDIYVATSQLTVGFQGYLAHYDGSAWSEVALPTTYPIVQVKSVYGAAGVVWAGANWNSGGEVPYGVLFTNESGGWTQEIVSPMTIDDEVVRSVWAGDGAVVISTDVKDSTRYWDANIFIKQDGTWTKMQTPPHQVPFRILKVWGRSADDLYAVGGKANAGPPISWEQGILWHYDGSTWSEVTTLPSDFTYFSDVHGNDDGEIYVTGVARYNDNGRGAVLVTTDLVDWARYDVAYLTSADSVATSRLGAAIVGLWMSDSPTQGDARVSVMSEWTLGQPQALGSSVNYVNGIQFVPNSDVAIAIATDGVDSGNVYRMTCQ